MAFDRVSGENVGSYNYTSGDINAYNTNYDITVDSTNKFSITVKSITVTADAQLKTFGDNDPELSYSTSVSTLPNGIEVSLSGSLTRVAGENVGEYNITQGTVTNANNSNYSLTFVGAKLKINKKSIKLCAEDKVKTYGDATPGNSVVLCDDTSFVGSDALGSVSYAYSTATPINAGDYTITPSAAVLSSGVIGNYDISYGAGTLTINQKQITITAADKDKIYGNSDPAFTYSITSGALVGSDALSGSLSRETGNDVGSYNIQQGSLTAGGNYDITFIDGELTIGKRDITVKPNTLSKAYGDVDPTFTFVVTVGTLAYSDSLAGALSRTTGEDVDVYTYLMGNFDSSNPNYNITLDDSNKFSITKKSITVTAEAKSKIFGEDDPALTFTTSVT
ncbi:MAG: hypothetical protein EBR26_06245, partial [Microbacteriaceae bacterium]|nr:hypothetical protein [Microbacteriaceae bacterium]